jgi:hypothetical protein
VDGEDKGWRRWQKSWRMSVVVVAVVVVRRLAGSWERRRTGGGDVQCRVQGRWVRVGGCNGDG